MSEPWTAYQTSAPEPAHPAAKYAAPKSFERQADFTAQMDRAFGPGKWKQTSGYRPPWHNYTVGGVGDSHHMMGSEDAPGAHDVVVPGLSSAQIEQRMKAAGIQVGKFYPEGDHLHVDSPTAPAAPAPWEGYGKPVGGSARKPQPAPVPNATPKVGPKPSTPGKPGIATMMERSMGVAPQPHPMSQIEKDQRERFHAGHVALDEALKAPPPTGSTLDQKEYADKQLTKAIGGLSDMAFSLPSAIVDKVMRPFVNGVNQTFHTNLDVHDVTDLAMVTAPMAGGAVGKVSKLAGESKLLRGAKALAAPDLVNDESKAAAALHRRVLGQRGTEADVEHAKLEKHQRVVGNLKPEEHVQFIDAVERKGKATIAKLPKAWQPAAKAVSDLAGRYRSRIEYVLGADGPNFIKNYYAHLWKDSPEKVEARMATLGGKQGSSKNLRKRTIPYYSDGLAAGLTPRYPNPLDAMSAYAANMSRYLGTHDILEGMKADKAIGAKFFTPGKQPEGWVPLNGMKSEQPARTIVKGEKTTNVPAKKLYAPEGAARIYNNHISQGLDRGDIGPVYRGTRAVVNGLVQLKLGLSAFHAVTMGQESMVAEVARGIGELSRGKTEGLKTLAKSPVAPVTSYLKGQRLRAELIGDKAPSELSAKIADLHAKAGGRINMDRIYRTRAAGSFFQSLKRGTFKRDLSEAFGRTYKGGLGEKAKGAVDLAGNVIQATAAPIFEDLVPKIKLGAFNNRMASFLRENPAATQAEQEAFARKTLDSVDNRFGELMADNLFWHRITYQIAQLALLSPSWKLGTLREIGGGALEIPKSVKGLLTGKGITDKTAYIIGLLTVNSIQNGIATKLHTGENPTGMDFFAYRTGGIDPVTHQPERALVPGYMKDILAVVFEGPGKWLLNSLNPGVGTAVGLATNKDYRGLPIYPGKGVKTQPGDKGVIDYAADQALPISLNTMKAEKGSKLSPWERFAAVRPAPHYVEDPEGTAKRDTYYAQKDWNRKRAADKREQQRLEP